MGTADHSTTVHLHSQQFCPQSTTSLTRSKPIRHSHTLWINLPQEGGLVLVAPEWRLSLQLKQQELWERAHRGPADGPEAAAAAEAAIRVLKKIEALPYADIIDESDEQLRHK